MTKSLIFKIICSVVLGIVSLATFDTSVARTDSFFGESNLLHLGIYVLFLASLLFIFRGVSEINLGDKLLPRWMKKLVIILPILAVIFAIINAAFPQVSELMRMSDTDIFQRPGAMIRVICEVTSFGLFLSLLPRFIKQKKWLAIGVVVIVAFILFFMAGEELSWGQRIFHWQTTQYFSIKNQQNETNLHDIHTQLFQNLLFFGGFLLLVVLPFFHDAFARALDKVKALRFMVNFLPESWMIVAFGAGLMFVDPSDAVYGLNWASISFQILATIVLLAVLTWRLRKVNMRLFYVSLLTLICGLVVVTLSLSFDTLWNINEGLPTEYIKLFIGFGILCWAIRTRQRVLAQRA